MPLRYVCLAAICALLASGGCTCSDRSQRSEGDGWVVGDVGFDAPDLADSGGGDWDVGPDVCGSNRVDFETVRFDIPFVGPAAPRVSGSSIYAERRAEDGSVEVTVVSPETGEVRAISASIGDTRLLDAASGLALVFVSPPDASPYPAVRTPQGNGWGLNGFPDRWSPELTRPRVAEGRPFDGDRYGAILENDPNSAPGWVGYYDGSESREVHIQEWTREPVALTPDGFVVAARTGPLSGGGNYEIYRYDGADGVQRVTTTEEHHERSPTADGAWVYWNHDSGVFRARAGDWEPESIHRGTCSSVDADGDAAVFSCEQDSPDRPGYERPVFGKELYYFDGSEARRVPTGGGFVYHPRVSGRRVVYATYDERSDIQRSGTGTLAYWELGWERPVQIAKIGAPCLGCDTRTPDLHLSIEGGRVAWNYATPNDDGPREKDFGAATRVVRRCP